MDDKLRKILNKINLDEKYFNLFYNAKIVKNSVNELENTVTIEISNENDHGQSTGIMITLPNSYVFTKNIKNYTKGFKYIWNELTMKVPVDCDLVNNKRELYRIVNNNENVKYIVEKMKVQSNVVGTTNNIYFSKYDPIIYTKIVDEHIELTIRYLVDPKKSRIVESMIWNKIFESYNEGKINLYLKG